jgi:hypothetical protein
MREYLYNSNKYKLHSITPNLIFLKTSDIFFHRARNKNDNKSLTTLNYNDNNKNKTIYFKHKLIKVRKFLSVESIINNSMQKNFISNNQMTPNLTTKELISPDNSTFKTSKYLRDNIRNNLPILSNKQPLIFYRNNYKSKNKKYNIKAFNINPLNKKLKNNNNSFSRNYLNVDTSYQKFIKYLKRNKTKQKEMTEKILDYNKKKDFEPLEIFKDSFKIKKLSKLELNIIQNGFSLLKKIKKLQMQNISINS